MKTVKTYPVLGKTGALMITLFSMLFMGKSSIAQEQFLWTGQDDNKWTNPNNWVYYPLPSDGGGLVYPAPYYPGQNIGANPNVGEDDVAMFSDTSSVNCNIDLAITDGVCSALRIAGIHVVGYTGTITQLADNRFIVAESYSGLWDGTVTIESTESALDDFVTTQAYLAYFDFTGSFLGTTDPPTGCNPDYTMLFAVPFDLVDAGTWRAPKGELRIRNHATILDETSFDHHSSTVVLSNRSGGASIRTYSFEDVDFYDMKVTPNGGTGVTTKEFVDGSFTVEHDFMTTGGLGRLDGTGSSRLIMNADGLTQIHVKNDIIAANKQNLPSYTAALAAGSLELVLDGTGDQRIEDPHNTDEYSGNLPALIINKDSGDVYLKGIITVNNFIRFEKGIVYPTSVLTNQNNLTGSTDHFLLNSFTTVSDASDLSYCEGPIKCRTGKTIELPLGKNGVYRPAMMNAVSGVSPAYSSINTYYAEYFDAIPTVGTSPRESALTEVSDCEVWAIQKEDLTDSYVLDLELSYESTFGGSCTDLLYDYDCKRVVSRWDYSGGLWLSHGGEPGVISGDPAIGSTENILTADFERSAIGRADLFTFGQFNDTECDTCDISVYANYCVEDCVFSFDAIHTAGTDLYSVDWNFGDGTASGESVTHTFGSLGTKTVSVTVCAVIAGDTCCATYSFGVINNDCTPAMSMAPPKTETETEENNTTFNVIEENKGSSGLSIQPNPSYEGEVTVMLSTRAEGNLDYTIMNNQGAVLKRGVMQANQSQRIDTSELAPGMYFITIYVENEKITERLMINE